MLLFAQLALAVAALACTAAIIDMDELNEQGLFSTNIDEDYDQTSIEMNYEPSDWGDDTADQKENDDEFLDEHIYAEGKTTIQLKNFTVGSIIRLTYPIPPQGTSMLLLNLMSDSGEILLHMNPRYNAAGPVLVLNAYLNGGWGTEERPAGFPSNAANVQVVVSVEESGYNITVNGGAVQYLFKHRRPLNLVTSLTTDIDDVQYGAVVSKDSIKVGKVIYVNGLTPASGVCTAGVCNINVFHGLPSQLATPLITASGPDVALHVNPRFSLKHVVRNTFTKGNWGKEETEGGIPFTPNSPFIVAITLQRDRYEIAVNGDHFSTYTYRLPLTSPVTVLVATSLLGNSVGVEVF